MDSAPILLPSPRKSPFQPPYEREVHLDNTSSDEDPYSYDHEHSPDEAVFDEDSQEDSQESQSPHTSDDDLISEFPTDADSRAPSTIYTPHKRRSPFRHPSSVRNLQLDTTPPHLASPPKSAYRLSPSPHTRNSTPRSAYSTHSRPRSTRSSPSKKEKTKKPKTERPLVLLHFTLLPFQLQYAQSLVEEVLPASKLADIKLLKEKLGQSVVQERGVLIPHPRDDYDLLEERLLEALELEQGTLTRDGHFILPEERGASRASRSVTSTRHNEEDEQGNEQDTGDENRTEMGDDDEPHLCEDCGKHIQTIGSDHRWEIRIYAANGLMREGAWSAAWHEMERVDVEIQPFLNDEMKRDLENRIEEMELLLQADRRESAARRHEEAATQEVIHAVEQTTQHETRVSGLDEDRLREIYGAQAEEKIEELAQELPSQSPPRRVSFQPAQQSSKDLPLSKLLVNYIQLVLQDRKNVAIGFLSTITLLLAIIAAQSKQPNATPLVPPIASVVPEILTQALLPVQQLQTAASAVTSAMKSEAVAPISSASSVVFEVVAETPSSIASSLGLSSSAGSVVEEVEATLASASSKVATPHASSTSAEALDPSSASKVPASSMEAAIELQEVMSETAARAEHTSSVAGQIPPFAQAKGLE